MAERFVGMTVALTLSNNAQLKGTVSKVDSTTQILHLHDVSFLPNGGMVSEYSIEASHISSLEIVPSGPAQIQPPPIPKPAPEFHDPAILSFSRKPAVSKPVAQQLIPSPRIPSPKMPSQPMMQPPTMIRTASLPKQPILPDIDSLNITTSDLPIPGILTHPNLLRPKARKPPLPPTSPPTLSIPTPQPKRKSAAHSSSQRRHRAPSRVSDSGWLTDEIVADQLSDFDFQSNLTKFDKRRDWEEFRKLDTTDPTSLLVWNNRTATAPKYENLSHKTNVLDSVESSDESEEEPAVRRGSRAKRATTSRKTSGIGQGAGGSRGGSVSAKWRAVGDEGSEIIKVTAEQMTNAEKLALEGGMSEDVLVENAARGIAEAVLTSLGAKRLDKKNHNPAPLIVVLAGNNRTGAYSLGAGRWLSIRGIRVLGVISTTEGEELEIIRTQSKLFKSAGGRLVVPADLQRTIAALPSPPEMIIDGLFGYLHSLEDLWDDEDKVTCMQLIKWANHQRGRRISIDKPAVAKEAEEDVDVTVAAEWIIAVGALKEDVTVEKGTRLFVVDVGLGKSVWRGVGVGSAGGKKRKGDLGIVWGGKWAVEVELFV